MMPRTKIMVVFGSGRSGTSAIAKGLHLAGWPMGPDLLPGNPSNPHGHWEDREAVQLNDRILGHHGGAWNDPPTIVELHPDMVDAVATYIGSRVERAHGGQWGVKDPRLTFTWPYWSVAFGWWPDLEPITVAAHRSPDAVVSSLVARDGGTAAGALALTRRYHDRVLELWG